LRYAGARPAQRDTVDARIVAGVESGTSRIIDNPAQAGGLQDAPPAQLAVDVPADAFASAGNGQLQIEAWLCSRSQALGAAPTPECPANTRHMSQRR
jgi:hypothetical protein